LVSRIGIKVVENGIKKVDDMRIKKVVENGIKKVDVPHRLQGRRHEDQKGRRPGPTSWLSKLESKRLMSRTIKKVVENGIKKLRTKRKNVLVDVSQSV